MVSAAKYRPGDQVRVQTRVTSGHHRTPEYVQGKTGRVRRYFGRFPNPETLAYRGTGKPEMPLYQVEFRQRDLWRNYAGSPTDILWIDLYEHWLDPAKGDKS